MENKFSTTEKRSLSKKGFTDDKFTAKRSLDIKGFVDKKSNGKTVTGQPADKIIVQPSQEDIKEAAVVIFGRMNPPTIGHERLIEHAKNIGGDVLVYLSHSHDEDSNPLCYEDKLALARTVFDACVVESSANTIFKALTEISGNYKNVTVLCGADRFDEWTNNIPKYNGKEFTFENISIEQIEREGETLAEQASASSLRDKIRAEDDTFVELLPEVLRTEETVNFILEKLRAGYSMVLTTDADGKPIWRKQRHMLSKDKKEQPYNMSVNEDVPDRKLSIKKVGMTVVGALAAGSLSNRPGNERNAKAISASDILKKKDQPQKQPEEESDSEKNRKPSLEHPSIGGVKKPEPPKYKSPYKVSDKVRPFVEQTRIEYLKDITTQKKAKLKFPDKYRKTEINSTDDNA